MAAVFRVMNRHDLAAKAELDAHSIDAATGRLNAEGMGIMLAAHEQSETYTLN